MMDAVKKHGFKKNWRAALATVVIFVVLGPPLGALLLSLLLPVFVIALGSDTMDFSQRLAAIFRMITASVLQSYVQGGAQAAATGLAVAAYGFVRGRPTLLAGVAASALTWIGFTMFAALRDAPESLLLLAVHLGSALACGWLSLRIWARMS